MKQFTRRVRQAWRAFFNSRTAIALIGLFLSVALHELFHVVMHWGYITQVHFFPNHTAIVDIISITQKGYDVQLEEAIAYTITILTLLITAVAIGKMSDKKDTRSVIQTLFPKNKTMQQLPKQELFELASRVNLL